MGDLFILAISCILINNILLAQYLGNCRAGQLPAVNF